VKVEKVAGDRVLVHPGDIVPSLSIIFMSGNNHNDNGFNPQPKGAINGLKAYTLDCGAVTSEWAVYCKTFGSDFAGPTDSGVFEFCIRSSWAVDWDEDEFSTTLGPFNTIMDLWCDCHNHSQRWVGMSTLLLLGNLHVDVRHGHRRGGHFNGLVWSHLVKGVQENCMV
jgi:hypothetical protein